MRDVDHYFWTEVGYPFSSYSACEFLFFISFSPGRLHAKQFSHISGKDKLAKNANVILEGESS